jgi:hypothetical protein
MMWVYFIRCHIISEVHRTLWYNRINYHFIIFSTTCNDVPFLTNIMNCKETHTGPIRRKSQFLGKLHWNNRHDSCYNNISSTIVLILPRVMKEYEIFKSSYMMTCCSIFSPILPYTSHVIEKNLDICSRNDIGLQYKQVWNINHP